MSLAWLPIQALSPLAGSFPPPAAPGLQPASAASPADRQLHFPSIPRCHLGPAQVLCPFLNCYHVQGMEFLGWLGLGHMLTPTVSATISAMVKTQAGAVVLYM